MFRLSNLFSFISGAVTVLAFAPFELFFIPFLTLGFLFYQWLDADRKQAASSGYFFGLGLMGFGVFWLHVSISKFGGVTLPLAIILALIFAATMALYYALTGWLSVWMAQRLQAGPAVRLLFIFPAILVLVEIIRAYFLGGFPWLSMGYSQLDSSLVALAPLMGVFAVSWITAFLAALAVLLLKGSQQQRLLSIAGAILIVAGTFWLNMQQWSSPTGKQLSVRLVQANIPQELKWQPANLGPSIDLYSRLTFQQHADLVVWPETAIPAFAHTVETTVLQPLREQMLQQGSELVVGIPIRAEDHGYFNSMLSLGEGRDQYDKRHLVPFGEFAPLDFLLRPLVDYFKIPMSDFREGEAEKPLLKTGQYQAGVSICYEDAFGNETIQSLPEADFLINVSNDAWFGDSLAPYQHLQIARMRAVETGRYMLRATNTGISAVINQHGSIIEKTGQAETAVIHTMIQPMQGMTPYALTGDWLIMTLLIISVVIAYIRSSIVRSKNLNR